MKQEWCVYSNYDGPHGVGKVVERSENMASILYNDLQRYTDVWSMEWLKIFDSFTEAVEYYLENKPEDHRSNEYILKELNYKFKGLK